MPYCQRRYLPTPTCQLPMMNYCYCYYDANVTATVTATATAAATAAATATTTTTMTVTVTTTTTTSASTPTSAPASTSDTSFYRFSLPSMTDVPRSGHSATSTLQRPSVRGIGTWALGSSSLRQGNATLSWSRVSVRNFRRCAHVAKAAYRLPLAYHDLLAKIRIKESFRWAVSGTGQVEQREESAVRIPHNTHTMERNQEYETACLQVGEFIVYLCEARLGLQRKTPTYYTYNPANC